MHPETLARCGSGVAPTHGSALSIKTVLQSMR